MGELTTYVGVQLQGRYWVDLHVDSEWTPVRLVRPLRHHASRLELTNLEQFPELARWTDRTLRFVVELTGKETRKVAHAHQWRSRYLARIVSVCSVTTAPTAAPPAPAVTGPSTTDPVP